VRGIAPQVAAAFGVVLDPGEPLHFGAIVVTVAYGSGTGNNAMTTAVGSRLGRLGSIRGGPSSVAASIPAPPTPGSSASWLVVTDRRLAFATIGSQKVDQPAGQTRTPALLEARLYWQGPLNWIVAVEKRPRMQLMARFRLRFADGSSAAFMTLRASDVRSLRECLLWLSQPPG
jgi:hypothetical protein